MTTESSMARRGLAAKISNIVVHALCRTTGRGPTKARTTLGTNGVFVVLQDTLTRGEQTLADAGQGEAVLDLRPPLANGHEAGRQPRDRGAHRTQGDRLHQRQPHRPRPRCRSIRAGAAPERGRSLTPQPATESSTRRRAQSAVHRYFHHSAPRRLKAVRPCRTPAFTLRRASHSAGAVRPFARLRGPLPVACGSPLMLLAAWPAAVVEHGSRPAMGHVD